jgi:hypothetical protein
MRLVAVRTGLLAAAAALLWAAAATAAPTSEAKPKPASPAEKIRQDLDQSVTLDITEQPLNLAVQQLKEQTKINFVLDTFTLQQMGIDPQQMPVTVKLKDVKLRTALRTIFDPYNLSYAVIGDTVLISTEEAASFRQMRQRVNVDLDGVEFAEAIKQLSRETGVNLVLDPAVAKEAQGKVTLRLTDAQLDGVVVLMCQMVGLKRVRLGNTLFICSKQVAKELQSDPDFNPNIPRNPDGTPIPVPPNPGIPGLPGGAILPGMGVVPGAGGFAPGGPGVPRIQILPDKDQAAPIQLPIQKVPETQPQPPKVEDPLPR